MKYPAACGGVFEVACAGPLRQACPSQRRMHLSRNGISLAPGNIWRKISVMKKIVAIKSLDGFRLWLRFSDGIEGTADLSDLAGHGVFSAWNTPGFFASVSLTEYGTVAWENQIDLCPDALYLRVTGKTPEDLFPSLRQAAAHA